MSDGQSELGESIQQQNACCYRTGLVGNDAFKWQDAYGGWHIGRKVWCVQQLFDASTQWLMIDSTGDHWVVSDGLLSPYGPRCEACGGEGAVPRTSDYGVDYMMDCPACGG